MFEKETEKRRFETMKKSIYTQYCEQKLPKKFQKQAEGNGLFEGGLDEVIAWCEIPKYTEV